jgi:glycosyltransferase involved in cell wall biosynthesis
MRWAWRYEDYAAREQFGKVTRKVLPIALSGLQRWDLRAAQQPDYYIVNSHVVAERVKETYGRDSIVIPPPIDVNRFRAQESNEPDDDFYLVLSRMIGYKRLDVAIEACKKLNRRLIVIGDGPDRKRLESLAGKETEFLGLQPDDVAAKYASRCRALLFPGEEDFGMVPLEVNAAGRPVIAYRAGGATETVVDGETGVFFDRQTAESLSAAIEDFENREWNRQTIRQHAEKFGTEIFTERIQKFLREVAPVSCKEEIMRVQKKPAFALSEVSVA